MRMGAKQLVEQAVHELFDRRDVTAVGRYWSPGYVEHSILGADGLEGLRDVAGSLPEGFRQHNPQIAEGASGLGRAIRRGVWEAVVDKVHRIVAAGEFVFTRGESMLRGNPTAFYKTCSGCRTTSWRSTGMWCSRNQRNSGMTTDCSDRLGYQVRDAACRGTAHARDLSRRHNRNATRGPYDGAR
jgi:predicted SnoaL-like aldol condensation-catalyzing enzyme